jgi:phage terminase large subunit-like protein
MAKSRRVDGPSPKSGQLDHVVWHDELPGFGVWLRGNSKRWVIQYRAGIQQRREILGDVRKVRRAASRGLQLDLQQAALIFAEMKAIIEAVPEFEARCNIQRYGKVIEVMEGDGAGSSADDKRARGLSPSFWVFDEYAQAPNSALLDNLRTAMGKRSESLGVNISKQAANDLHPLSQLTDDALLGEDPSVYLKLAVAPAEADIFDEKTWFACNEALGKFLDAQNKWTYAQFARSIWLKSVPVNAGSQIVL